MQQTYRFKLILSNNKGYDIQTPIGNITEFATSVFKTNSVQDFLLSKPYTDNDGYTVDTIMVKLDNIIAIEYSTQ